MCETSRRCRLFRPEPGSEPVDVTGFERRGDPPADRSTKLVAVPGAGGDHQGLADGTDGEALVSGKSVSAGYHVGDCVLVEAGKRRREPAPDLQALAGSRGA